MLINTHFVRRGAEFLQLNLILTVFLTVSIALSSPTQASSTNSNETQNIPSAELAQKATEYYLKRAQQLKHMLKRNIDDAFINEPVENVYESIHRGELNIENESLGQAEAFIIKREYKLEIYPGQSNPYRYKEPDNAPLKKRYSIGYKVVEAQTGVSFIFINGNEVETDNLHLKQFLAKENVNFKQNAVLIEEVNGNIHSTTSVPKAQKISDKVKRWWQAKKAPLPQMGDAVIASLSISVDQLFILFAAGVSKLLDPNFVFNTDTLILPVIFGGLIGLNHKLYRNIVLAGPRYKRIPKQMTITLLYNLSFVMLFKGGEWSALSLTTSEGLWNIFVATFTAFVSQRGASYIDDIWIIRNEARANSGLTHLGIPGTNKKLYWDGHRKQKPIMVDKAGAEYQINYRNWSKPFKVLSLSDVQIFNLPIGIITLAAAKDIFQWISLREAKKSNSSKLEEIKSNWEKPKIWRDPIKFAKSTWDRLSVLPVTAGSHVKFALNTCEYYLSGKAKNAEADKIQFVNEF